MDPPLLLAVPNVSEGRSRPVIDELAAAFSSGGSSVRLLDVHSDADHHRSVFTVAGPPGELAQALLAGARVAVQRVEVCDRAAGGPLEDGVHPHVGALDVVPIVHLRDSERGAACALALLVADRLAVELGLPVFLYGELTHSDGMPARTRAQLRRGGVPELARRMRHGSADPLRPDFGPARLHPRAGATLVAARPPLAAFNLQLGPGATLADARAIAADLREGGAQGLPGLRAIAVELDGGIAQVSMNVERPAELPLARILAAVVARAPVASAEIVGLVPAQALAGFPEDLPIPGFDPARHILENALGC